MLALYAMMQGGVDTGWTFYTPYSTTFSNGWVMVTGLGVFINGFSSILTGLNFIVTIHTMRAPGMTWFRMPLFIWSHYATQFDDDFGNSCDCRLRFMLALERVARIGIFDPAIGGDPILFPAFILVLFASGSLYYGFAENGRDYRELISNFRAKEIFGYEFVAFFHHCDCGFRLFRLGTSHICSADNQFMLDWSFQF